MSVDPNLWFGLDGRYSGHAGKQGTVWSKTTSLTSCNLSSFAATPLLPSKLSLRAEIAVRRLLLDFEPKRAAALWMETELVAGHMQQ
ncbi:hypothetical protein BU17DRAFT_86108 [Hysterangium stoloniferum]|nr:hypothetical protein BU17DRAFT_86108 [Hysterangium stoloniferum]